LEERKKRKKDANNPDDIILALGKEGRMIKFVKWKNKNLV